jgi:hypothetical protein
MADVPALTGQTSSFTIVIMDSQVPPQPAPVDGIPVYATSDATVLTVTPAADGMSGTVATGAVPTGQETATANFTVTADADLGSGVQTITGVSDNVVVSRNPNTAASTFTITLSPFTNV